MVVFPDPCLSDDPKRLAPVYIEGHVIDCLNFSHLLPSQSRPYFKRL